jgi:hypothetical protein
MATLTLYRDDWEDGELPSLCMRCGQPATLVKEKTFSWGPGWAMVLLAAGMLCSGPLILAALILILVLLKRMRVPVPLCDRHRHHWRALQVLLYGGTTIVALLLCTTIVLFIVTGRSHEPGAQLGGWFCFATIVFLVAMLFPAAVMQTRVIRPIEITDRSITLINVAEPFVQIVEQADKSKRARPADHWPPKP